MHVLLLIGLLVLTGAGLMDVPAAAALEIGKPAPDFTLPATTGEHINLRRFRGQKLVLIEFFGAAFAPT
ncbi:MAG: hypothetical protein ABW216_07325 [Candidatus Rokuibacteriota bacterium]|jgi:hypothetical protein